MGYWSLRLQSVGADQNPVLEVEREHADQRLALLDVFGWLWLRTMPQPSADSPWVRRHDPVLPVVQRTTVKGSHIADPEDLDPAEIALVHKTRK
jgi:hypothetical protein